MLLDMRMETKKRYKVQQNKTDTRKENITTTKSVCVFVARLFVQQERQSVLVRDQHFVDSWWQQFLCRCSRFWQEKARRVPNRHDRGAETIFAVYCFSDTRRLVTKMLTMLVRVARARRKGGSAYNVQPTLITMLSRVGFTKPPPHEPRTPTTRQHFTSPTPNIKTAKTNKNVQHPDTTGTH